MGVDKPIPQRVVDLARGVYAADAGLTGSGATSGLTKMQVTWAWAVVGLSPAYADVSMQHRASEPQGLVQGER